MHNHLIIIINRYYLKFQFYLLHNYLLNFKFKIIIILFHFKVIVFII